MATASESKPSIFLTLYLSMDDMTRNRMRDEMTNPLSFLPLPSILFVYALVFCSSICQYLNIFWQVFWYALQHILWYAKTPFNRHHIIRIVFDTYTPVFCSRCLSFLASDYWIMQASWYKHMFGTKIWQWLWYKWHHTTEKRWPKYYKQLNILCLFSIHYCCCWFYGWSCCWFSYLTEQRQFIKALM